ncbi:hypothetical protein VE00_10813 [Pseudogymnoascus sp. WSF 3629]|nr:hypothetical protein VE00_10813 [Pseudogymnoascus sp. WSF 3629]
MDFLLEQFETAKNDKTVKIWNARTGLLLQILEGHTSAVFSVAFSPDGTKLASASYNKTARVWDVVTGTLLLTLRGHTSAVFSVAFSPDGTKLASASYDKTLNIWDAVTGALLQTLEGHTNRVYSVAFSPDSKLLASASYDTTVRLWDATTYAALQTLQEHSSKSCPGMSPFSVTFSPDGNELMSASLDMTWLNWPIDSKPPITVSNDESPVYYQGNNWPIDSKPPINNSPMEADPYFNPVPSKFDIGLDQNNANQDKAESIKPVADTLPVCKVEWIYTLRSQEEHNATTISIGDKVVLDIVAFKDTTLEPRGSYVGKYLLNRKIGQGKFSGIYLGTDGSQEVAIKLQSINAKESLLELEHEANIYKKLAGGVGIPTMHFSRLPHAKYYAIIIDLLGPSLEDLFNFCGRKFSQNTVLLLLHQLITLIEYIHTKNYVHGDVNPKHLLMGRGKQGNQVNIIDFYFAQPFGDEDNGTAHSASIHAHQGIKLSRGDDLVSLGDTMIYFLLGSCQWQGLVGEGMQDFDTIKKRIIGTSTEALYRIIPEEFANYMRYARSLGHDDKPDYTYLRKIFTDLKSDGSVYDWLIIKKKKSDRSSTSTDKLNFY